MTELEKRQRSMELHDAARAAYREAGYLDPVETTHAAVMAFFNISC